MNMIIPALAGFLFSTVVLADSDNKVSRVIHGEEVPYRRVITISTNGSPSVSYLYEPPPNKQAGIGAILSVSNGAVVVTEIYNGSPAQRSGLKVGDIITSVNSVKLQRHPPLSHVVHIMRGEPGSKVFLGTLRQTKQMTHEIVREPIDQIKPVNPKAPSNKIRISSDCESSSGRD